MGKFHVVYFGSNDVPVDLIKPILAEINADMTIRRPASDADVIEMAKDADGIIMHGSVPLSREIISKITPKTKVVCRTGVGVDRMDLKAASDHVSGSDTGYCHALFSHRANQTQCILYITLHSHNPGKINSVS